ncbi:sialidase family protein [Chloroflexus sp.]|uniref:WD40/YVTN/BNR-like repeat-containing protein n=1 Tax=Chloroflexus sp. TaxID=1904827 RepID=UPI00298F3A0D|nr:sialidase family protein [Chloroflexus sp.]MCS6887141.1 glycoside hydrolase [Chloroflexus sp.]MDW8403241.1 sialidase family protein [Chloroflexus sp.]
MVDTARRILYLYRWGDHLLYRSDDFGEHWQIVSMAMYYQVALAPQSNGALYAIHGDWRMRRSDDGGFTWRDLAQPLAIPDETALAVAPNGTLYAIANRQLFRSSDGGLSWTRWGD